MMRARLPTSNHEGRRDDYDIVRRTHNNVEGHFGIERIGLLHGCRFR